MHLGLPALADTAKRLGQPAPALAPRIKLRLTCRPQPAGRVLGAGTLEQIHDHLVLLDRLGAETVILDPTFPASGAHPERAAADLAAFERPTEGVIDLEHGRLH
ncbi:hypothetical protein OIB37_35575 [Streptomyces sp. NBC_00820]|uniref:hypothetical protein n=1 Tax=Streptomyces sp. NBC_00820 TaxID=2975842 RepID=UPI002ED367D1|nr:hypothetical protein OIB37_35575 [Streptomyces sp. NBC_00820]